MTSEPSALQVVRERRPGFQPRIAVVLGSGWATLVGHLRNPVRINYSELDGFPRAGVGGHAGELWLGHLGDQAVVVMSGRQHGYETGAVDGMKRPLQTLRALGCEVLVQTNAAGSLRAGMPPGRVMLITDHLNLPQRSPLVGESGPTRFVDMRDAYDLALRRQALAVSAARHVIVSEGVYAWCFGPQFETPAEIRMCQALGADAVGMSTVPETILARHLGLRVLALSLITNMGAGLSDERLSHAHTLSQARITGEVAADLLSAIVADLDLETP